MKKIIRIIPVIGCVIVLMGIIGTKGQAAENTLYTATISTLAITNAAGTSDINLSEVKVKSVTIANTTATAQTITIYKNGNSTTTITAVYVMAVPATIGTYECPPFKSVSNVFTNADLTNIPYFTVRTSTDTNAAKVNVIYWK